MELSAPPNYEPVGAALLRSEESLGSFECPACNRSRGAG